MAGNARFHNKWHRRNHHSSPSIGYPDSATDPIGSPEEPFIGDFVLTGNLSAHKNAYIDGDTSIQGNLSVFGNLSYFDTVVSVTSSLSVINHGNDTALTIVQYGQTPIAQFLDGDAEGDDYHAFHINNEGYSVFKGYETKEKYDPYENAEVKMDVTVNGNAYAKKAFIWERPDGNTVYVSTTGSDLNSGLNRSQKVKTIKKACQIVFDKYGGNKATIQVEAGDYTEINPIYVPAGTSIIGEGFLRRNILRPYHKQQDFFWLNNGCYLWGFTFRDTWDGCASTAFPNLLSSTPGYQIAFNTPDCVIDVKKPGGPFGLPLVSKPYIVTSPYTQGMSTITRYQVVPIQPNLEKSYVKPETQVTDDVRTTGGQASAFITTEFTTIADIIRYGSSAAPALIPPSGPVAGTDDAVALIEFNRSFIQDATIQYVNQNFPRLAYNQAKCFRDVGYILDGVIYDMYEGTNLSAINVGNSYFYGVSSYVEGQQVETAAAILFVNSLVQYIITNRIYPWYSQRFDDTKTLGQAQSGNINSSYNTITSIIRNGIASLPPPVTYTVTTGISDAVNLITINKPFIQKTVVNYVDKTFPGFAYNKDLCYRDVGYILDAIVNDVTNSNNLCAIWAGKQYYNGNNTSRIVGQEVQTIAAINYANFLTQKVITNTIAVTSQSYAPFLSSGYLAVNDINRSFDNITKIILTSEIPALQKTIPDPSNADLASTYIESDINTITTILCSRGGSIPALIPPGSPYPGAVDAANLLDINKEYIKRMVKLFLDKTYPSFRYNVGTCLRDVGLIVDCVRYDLLNGTNLSAISAGQSYLDGQGGTIIGGQEGPTIAAINFINTAAQVIIKNKIQPIFGQYFNNTYLNGNDVSNEVDNAFTLISNTILSGIGTWTPTPPTFSPPSPGAAQAKDLLLNNKSFLQSEVINYVNSTFKNFEYNIPFCYRDSGYMVDAVTTDITNGNYLSSTDAASFYFKGNITIIKGQQAQTASAIQYENRLSQNIINNVVSYPRSDAATLLKLNKTFIQKEVIEYIGKAYPRLVYNKAKCERDVGYIVDSIVYDITYGTDLSSISAGTFYLNNAIPANQKFETIAAINYAKYLSQFIVQNRPVENINAGTGIRVDGELALGFLRSFVTDSFTQFNAGGKGIHIINCGYAQLVSTFTICTTEGVFAETGGNCSISTSNCSFGLSGLVATGKSKFPVLTGAQTVTTALAENTFIVENVTPKPLSAFVAALQAGYEIEGIPMLEPYNGLLINVQDDPRSDYDEFLNPKAELYYHSIRSVSATDIGNKFVITLEKNVQAPLTASSTEPKLVKFYLRSQIASSSHAFEYIGTGVDLELAVPALGGKTKNENEAVYSDNGIVYYSSTNERGDFKVGGGFKIVQSTGTIKGIDFNKSILALVTPLILSLD